MKKLFTALALTVCSTLCAQTWQDGKARFTVITDGVIRMEWNQEGQFTDEASFLRSETNLPATSCKVKETKSQVQITTKTLLLTYKKGTGKFTKDNLSIKYLTPFGDGKKKGFTWHPGDLPTGNLMGTYRTLDGYDGDKYWAWERKGDGKEIPLEPGLLATCGWTLLDDSDGLLFDGDPNSADAAKPLAWVKQRVGERQDWIFMGYGHDYKQALKDYTVFAGKVPLPPRYAFGYWWSRYWAYSDAELRQLVKDFKQYDIPLDVFVIDMDWHWTEEGKGGWTGYTWNKRLFPEPAKFLSFLRKNDLHITMNLHPADGVPAYEAEYPALAREIGFDASTGKTIPWESSNRRFMQGYYDKMLRPLEKEGVDFWWLDWQQGLFDTKIPQLSNTWWLNYCTFMDMKRNRPDVRPMLYHRWGGIGNHRYQVGFSGDTYSTWASLDYQVYFNSTSSNVLYGYWSHDLGGHMFVNNGDKLDPELYIRWMQFGAFSPIMRSHSTKDAAMQKEPWNQGTERMNILHDLIRQRYALVPYIYTMARQTYETGLCLCRPMYYDYPESAEAYTMKNEYMFGDRILVHPVTKPMQDERSQQTTWLPEGEWYEWSTGTMLKGGQKVDRTFRLDEIPVYVKAASILPQYGEVQNLSGNAEAVTLTIFPGCGESSLNLYEDNGNDRDYADNYAITPVSSVRTATSVTLTMQPRQGTYEGMPSRRDYSVQVLGSSIPTSVRVDGKDVDYTFTGSDLSVTISLPAIDCSRQHTVVVTYADDAPVVTDGLMHKMKLMQKTMTALKFRFAGVNYIEGLGEMGSLAQMLEYFPERFSEMVRTFNANYEQLPELLDRQKLSEEDKAWFLRESK